MTKFMLTAIVALSGSLAFALQGNSAPCEDGDTKIFYEARSNGLDGMVYVTRTCKNGSYYPKSTTVGKGCVDGQRATFTEVDDLDRAISKTYVCTNGTYYPNAPKTVGKPCVEGRRAIFTEVDHLDRAISNTYVCTNGKYVKVN